MKINFLITSILGIVTTSAFSSPNFYGKIDTSIDYIPEKMQTPLIAMYGK